MPPIPSQRARLKASSRLLMYSLLGMAVLSADVMIPLAASAASPAAATVKPVNEEMVAALQVLIERHPELIANALATAQKMQREERAEKLIGTVGPIIEHIRIDPNVPSVGPANGKLVVEFFDYNCHFCKQFAKTVEIPLLASRQDVHFFYVYAAILSEGSTRLAEISAAAFLQGKFKPVHDYLIASDTMRPTKELADAVIPDVVRIGHLDEAKLRRALADGSAAAIVKAHMAYTKNVDLTGTPTIWVNNQMGMGAIPYAQFLKVLDQPAQSSDPASKSPAS